MPPLQDSTLGLSDVRKTRLEVFFHFILFLLFFLQWTWFYGYTGLSSKWNMGFFHPNVVYYLPSKMSFGCNFFFLFFFYNGLSPSWAWSHTRDILFGVQAHLSFVRQVGVAIVLLSKHVFSLAALLRITSDRPDHTIVVRNHGQGWRRFPDSSIQ